MDAENSVRLGEWFTIAAVLAGPILALQVQKLLERSQAKRASKDWVFRTLMATRAAQLSPEHVQALNMIPIAFYGTRVLGDQRQTNGEKAVYSAWRSYLHCLNADILSGTDSQKDVWVRDRQDKFIDLLGKIATAQRFDFDPVDLRTTAYSPVHHFNVEAEHDAIRKGLASVLGGKVPLNMNVVNFPAQEAQ